MEQFTDKINCVVASCWTFIDIEFVSVCVLMSGESYKTGYSTEIILSRYSKIQLFIVLGVTRIYD